MSKSATELKAQAQAEGLDKLYEQLKTIDPATAAKISSNDARRIIRALEVYKLTGKPISGFQQQWDANASQDWTIIGLRQGKNRRKQTHQRKSQKDD